MSSAHTIRPATPSDLSHLPAIERAAAQLLEPWGLSGEALEETTPVHEFEETLERGAIFVAAAVDESLVGFIQIDAADGVAHIEELDVHPDHGRRGLGAALVERACAWARASGHPAITLTTFRDVPFNAPFYERLGFVGLDPDQLGPDLRRLLAREAAIGLPAERRLAMRRALD